MGVMAYKVLYRKYRPNSFKKIIGQKSIVDILQNSIINNKISHAYIFTGPRGTGKTSTAKVFAKAVNCENLKNGEPCEKCSSCLNFDTSPDIIEIDAASNNGVDEIRELRNNISLTPAESKYKVYIIDEVHMLSTGAFNALLKTLEEPPEHAIFILATTEIYKVPITILSRCQRYDFKKISKNDMTKYLEKILKQEEIEYDKEALNSIYELSDGCLRDALSIIDQNSKSNNSLKTEDLMNNYEIISNNTLDELMKNVKIANILGITEVIDSFQNSGVSAQRLLKKMISYLDNLALDIKLNKNNDFQFSKIKSLICELNKYYVDAKTNENTYSLIKLSILDQIDVLDAAEVVHPKLSAKEKKEILKQEESTVSIKDIRVNNCFCEASKDSLENIKSQWENAKKEKITGLSLANYSPVAASSKNVIFTTDDESLSNLFNSSASKIEKMLKKMNLSVKVIALTEEEWQNAKKTFIINKKNNIKYEYIEEPKKNEGTSKIKEEVNKIFDNKDVEIA